MSVSTNEFIKVAIEFVFMIAVFMLVVCMPSIYYHITDAIWLRKRRKEVQRFAKSLKIGDQYMPTVPPFGLVVVMSVDRRYVVYKYENGSELLSLSLDYFYDHFIKVEYL